MFKYLNNYLIYSIWTKTLKFWSEELVDGLVDLGYLLWSWFYNLPKVNSHNNNETGKVKQRRTRPISHFTLIVKAGKWDKKKNNTKTKTNKRTNQKRKTRFYNIASLKEHVSITIGRRSLGEECFRFIIIGLT